MARKRFTLEQIIAKLREAEVLIAQWQSVAHACKRIEVTEQTYYRWRRTQARQALRMKELEKENARLRRLLVDVNLDKLPPGGGGQRKLLSPKRCWRCIEHVRQTLGGEAP